MEEESFWDYLKREMPSHPSISTGTSLPAITTTVSVMSVSHIGCSSSVKSPDNHIPSQDRTEHKNPPAEFIKCTETMKCLLFHYIAKSKQTILESSKNHFQNLKETLALIEKTIDSISVSLTDVAKPSGIFVDSFTQNLSIHKTVFEYSFHIDVAKIFSKGRSLEFLYLYHFVCSHCCFTIWKRNLFFFFF